MEPPTEVSASGGVDKLISTINTMPPVLPKCIMKDDLFKFCINALGNECSDEGKWHVAKCLKGSTGVYYAAKHLNTFKWRETACYIMKSGFCGGVKNIWNVICVFVEKVAFNRWSKTWATKQQNNSPAVWAGLIPIPSARRAWKNKTSQWGPGKRLPCKWAAQKREKDH